MTAPEPAPGSRDVRRERLVGLLVLVVALVLLVSSASWFGTGRTGWGIAQLGLGVVLAVVGGLLYRRASRP
jgi:protein-S-isoprenylcysteine O-methyltransferase Ste14